MGLHVTVTRRKQDAVVLPLPQFAIEQNRGRGQQRKVGLNLEIRETHNSMTPIPAQCKRELNSRILNTRSLNVISSASSFHNTFGPKCWISWKATIPPSRTNSRYISQSALTPS